MTAGHLRSQPITAIGDKWCADHLAENPRLVFATFLPRVKSGADHCWPQHIFSSFFGLPVLSVCSHTLLYCKETGLVSLYNPPPHCEGFSFFFSDFFFPPKIKRHTPIYSTGNKDKSERLSRRWVFCLTNPEPPRTLFPLLPYRTALPGNLLGGDATFPAAGAEVIQKCLNFVWNSLILFRKLKFHYWRHMSADRLHVLGVHPLFLSGWVRCETGSRTWSLDVCVSSEWFVFPLLSVISVIGSEGFQPRCWNNLISLEEKQSAQTFLLKSFFLTKNKYVADLCPSDYSQQIILLRNPLCQAAWFLVKNYYYKKMIYWNRAAQIIDCSVSRWNCKHRYISRVLPTLTDLRP